MSRRAQLARVGTRRAEKAGKPVARLQSERVLFRCLRVLTRRSVSRAARPNTRDDDANRVRLSSFVRVIWVDAVGS